MKAVLLGIIVVVLMAASGGAGYYLGDQSGFSRAQNIRTEFAQQRFGGNAQGAAVDPSQVQGGQQGQSRSAGQGGQGGQGAGQFAGRPTANGTVKSVDGNKITVTQQDGSTTTVTVDSKAVIQKTGTGTVADIQPGLRITVVEQTTGNATTQRITLTAGQ